MHTLILTASHPDLNPRIPSHEHPDDRLTGRGVPDTKVFILSSRKHGPSRDISAPPNTSTPVCRWCRISDIIQLHSHASGSPAGTEAFRTCYDDRCRCIHRLSKRELHVIRDVHAISSSGAVRCFRQAESYATLHYTTLHYTRTVGGFCLFCSLVTLSPSEPVCWSWRGRRLDFQIVKTVFVLFVFFIKKMRCSLES